MQKSSLSLSLFRQYFLSWKWRLLFTSVAYIQVHFAPDFLNEANNMIPDQTAPLPWEQSDLDPLFALLDERVNDKSRDGREGFNML